MSVLLVLLFLSLATVNINEGCIESERQALLMFKHDVTDGANRLSSWSLHHGHGDCCQWDGVVCDNVTAHVLELHLANPRPLLDDYGSDAENEATERSKLRDCWLNWQNLLVIKLSNNRLNGSIPSSMGTLQSIVSLHLQKNHLSGEIPLSLNNCTDLILLDAGENELHGSIPRWIGDSLRKLVVLSLRSNKFSGYIPDELCAIGSLQVLDLADNNLIEVYQDVHFCGDEAPYIHFTVLVMWKLINPVRGSLNEDCQTAIRKQRRYLKCFFTKHI
ncbi:receptor-like protein EIX1 isoform X2 [Gossypium raimondii]|uniref:receptor-like protein EIX1 isoform X2 n=1 Tax=Gossypium raimondii TaxID=29730 RepID=UPI00227CF5D1|nr:receptor-like protein EIX1 isoform X2 [Gossypium raimondii]